MNDIGDKISTLSTLGSMVVRRSRIQFRHRFGEYFVIARVRCNSETAEKKTEAGIGNQTILFSRSSSSYSTNLFLEKERLPCIIRAINVS